MGSRRRPIDFVELIQAACENRVRLSDFVPPNRSSFRCAMRRSRAQRRARSNDCGRGRGLERRKAAHPRRGGAPRGYRRDGRPGVSAALPHRRGERAPRRVWDAPQPICRELGARRGRNVRAICCCIVAPRKFAPSICSSWARSHAVVRNSRSSIELLAQPDAQSLSASAGFATTTSCPHG
jgi:hypothetical protein